MQSLRITIEKVMGSLPAELQEVPEGDQPHTRPSSEPSSDSGGRPSRGDRLEQFSSTPSLPAASDVDQQGTGEEDNELMTRYESHNHQGGDGQAGGHSESGQTNGHAAGWLSASPTGADGARSGSSGGGNSSTSGAESGAWSRTSSNNPADIEALQKEKRQLRIVLKAYERC